MKPVLGVTVRTLIIDIAFHTIDFALGMNRYDAAGILKIKAIHSPGFPADFSPVCVSVTVRALLLKNIKIIEAFGIAMGSAKELAC